MFSRPKILFLVSLLFVALLNPKFNPYLLFKFLIFYDSSLFTFIHAKHLITQNVTGACVIIMLVNKVLTWQSSCVIAEKQQKLFVQGYNLEVHDVIKYM